MSTEMLRVALKTIRRDGYAYSDQEREERVRAIAAPIFNQDEERYCVTTSEPLFRLAMKKSSP